MYLIIREKLAFGTLLFFFTIYLRIACCLMQLMYLKQVFINSQGTV